MSGVPWRSGSACHVSTEFGYGSEHRNFIHSQNRPALATPLRKAARFFFRMSPSSAVSRTRGSESKARPLCVDEFAHLAWYPATRDSTLSLRERAALRSSWFLGFFFEGFFLEPRAREASNLHGSLARIRRCRRTPPEVVGRGPHT